MNFHSCEKQIFKSFGCTRIRNDSKWTKTSRNEVMQPTTSNSDSRPIFPYHVHNQAGFDNPFINGRGFIYLGISKMSFIFKYLQELSSVSIKTARKTNTCLHLSMPGQPQGILLREVLRNLRSSIDFYGFTDIQTVTFKEFFSFINFTFLTQKWENESFTIELVTRSEIFIF